MLPEPRILALKWFFSVAVSEKFHWNLEKVVLEKLHSVDSIWMFLLIWPEVAFFEKKGGVFFYSL